MKLLSRIFFPVAVMTFTTAGVLDLGNTPVLQRDVPGAAEVRDTVIYPPYNYRPRTSAATLNAADSLADENELPDSSLFAAKRLSPRDSLKALLDSTLWDKLDSIYIADSTARAKAKFDAWYASLSKEERKKYDKEQLIKVKMARADSVRAAKEKAKEIRDSIIEVTPRILETYAIPDSMQYKRIIAWTLDRDFGKLKPYIPDTSYNYHFYDYPFQRSDVNATWLGVAGSPVQYYDFLKRESDEGVEFYDAYESWSFSPRTLPHYNSKTPHTELAYFGTLFAKDAKESDNLHIFTTQNITPAFNFSFLYDRYGGGGMLENEETVNKTTVVQANYLGRKYSAHAGYIGNTISMGENGGMSELGWIRDTTVDSRDIAVNLKSAQTKLRKRTFFIDQQLRIPFNFINELRARRDSSYSYNADSLDRNITTAFVGHSGEISIYSRKYTDATTDAASKAYYNDVFNYNPSASADSLGVTKIDNKLYIRLQPWSSEGVVSKLDLGVGDYVKTYFDSTSLRPTKHTENSVYVYAGVEGQIRGNFFWNAKGRYVALGHDFGDFGLEADGELNFYPFRRARKSPVTLRAHFETTLREPTYYQQRLNANHYSWDNDFGKISTTKLSGSLDIPRWDASATLGYALLGNNIYYDSQGIIRQNGEAMSVLSASLRKDFAIGPLHLDNKVLLQYSSRPEVVPLPAVALNLRYYFQFTIQKVLQMQIGANAYCNTAWNSPAWNPNVGVFYNQDERQYTNGPFFDVFINMQWKRACIFIKYQNAGGGWPMDTHDYFSADRHIVTSNGMDGLKIGIFWPFYVQPTGRPPAEGSSRR